MLIATVSNWSPQRLSPGRSALVAPPSQPRERVDLTLSEGALAGAAIGSNWGTVGGAALGGTALVGGAGVLGWRLGSALGPWGAGVGAALGAAAAVVEERKYHLGTTAGGFVGLVAGGLVGGAIGAVAGLIR